MKKSISILGSTGSIGRNVLEVIKQFPERFKVAALAAGQNIPLLLKQVEKFSPSIISVANKDLAGDLIQSLPAGWGDKIFWGNEGNIRVSTFPDTDTVVSAIVGANGLLPTFAAVEAGKNIALANKETLVMAGRLVMEEVRQRNVSLYPVDSEHSAIFQSLAAGRKEDVAKIILTASGGPFLKFDKQQLWEVTPDQALAHPNWDMGNKISIDSATLMNKGLEVIEARWLFDIEPEKIEVLVHPQSIVHSMVEYLDGSVISQMGIPDMRIPIAYALSYPERFKIDLPPLDLPKCGNLSFHLPDFSQFPALELSYEVCKMGGTAPAIMNAANEVAVAAFLAGNIRFPDIANVVSKTIERLPKTDANDIQTVLDADLAARNEAESVAGSLAVSA